MSDPVSALRYVRSSGRACRQAEAKYQRRYTELVDAIAAASAVPGIKKKDLAGASGLTLEDVRQIIEAARRQD